MPRSARRPLLAAALTMTVAGGTLAAPEPANAGLLGKACGVIGTIGEGWWGKACKVVTGAGGKVLSAGKSLVTGKPGKAVKDLLGQAGKNTLSPSGALGIAAIVAWVVGGAHFVLSEISKLVGQSTSPELTAAWFSSVYWRVAGVAALLTLPFLCAAAIQAVLRGDGGLLARAVFGYLPLSLLATGVAAPVTMTMLQLTDWMGAYVAKAAGDQGSHFLALSGAAIGGLGVAIGSPFVTFLVALATAAGGLVLWLELLVREAAVYVVVLMLPLVFSAMVWPARRVWATRAVEVLAALILAKFAIVSVLALAAAALGHGGGSLIVRSLAGLVLVLLGAFAPWVLLRLLPLAEVASAAAGHVRENAQTRVMRDTALGRRGAATVGEGVSALMARMQLFQADANASGNGRTHTPGELAATTRVAPSDTPGRPGGAIPATPSPTTGSGSGPARARSAEASARGEAESRTDHNAISERPTLLPDRVVPDAERETVKPTREARHSETGEPIEPAALEDEARPKLPPRDPGEGTGT